MKFRVRAGFLVAGVLMFTFQSCALWMFDFTASGKRIKCLYLSTDSLKVRYECDEKEIASITVYENKSAREYFGKLIYSNPSVNAKGQFLLPLNRDSANGKFLQIEIHLSGDHYRMTYYIETKPGDIAIPQRIYSHFFSH